MDKFLINGPCKIKGNVSISGSKNASLPILAATLLFDKPVVIKNLPRVRDINTMLNLLKSLGSKIILSRDKKTAKIINKKNMKTFASYSLVKTMRGSILVLGPLISKYNKSKISLPGGCLIGARPTNFLNKAGAKIKWTGRVCKIIGVNSLNETEYSVMADRIEAGTFCVAATLAKGNLQINNLNPKIIGTEIKLLKKVGAKIKTSENKILIKGPEKIKSIKSIKTKEFPGIPTDLQAQLMVLMCKAVGKSSITESIFENRFMHVAELQRLGAKINIKNNTATIEGNTKFIGAELMSSDLRASVALVLAAIVSNGKSYINRIYHLDRGYEKIENKLKKIGVKIKRLK